MPQVHGPVAVPLRPTGRWHVPHCADWSPASSSPAPAMDAPSVDEPMDEQGPPTEVVREFDFAFSPAYAAAARPFGITAATTSVEVGPGWLFVRYGPWKLLTPRANVVAAHITGDFSFVKTAGPPHLSMSDRGVTMTSNGDRALCLEFARAGHRHHRCHPTSGRDPRCRRPRGPGSSARCGVTDRRHGCRTCRAFAGLFRRRNDDA